MKFLSYLKEEFCFNMKLKGYTDQENIVYIDPSKVEIIKASKACDDSKGEIRFIADSRDKKFYIWASAVETHPSVSRMLIRAGEIKNIPSKYGSPWTAPYFLMGIAKVEENAKLKLIRCDNWNWNEGLPFIKEAALKNWTWVKSYFSDMSWLENFKKEIK